jgi:hypothetical protein
VASANHSASKTLFPAVIHAGKFMPVKDSRIHEEVVEGLRPVVMDFANASRGNDESPAYTQLRRMLTAATHVVSEIKAGAEETVGNGERR